jgi:tetratricopeptide (TPR) repeat protein
MVCFCASFESAMRLPLYFLLLAFATCSIGQQRESDLDRYSDNARQALAAKKWEEAAQALEHLVRLAPDVPQVHANLGLAYFFEGRTAEALASFERARQLNPQLTQIKTMIGLADAELGRCTAAISVLAPAFEHPSDQETDRLIGLHLLHCYSQLKQPGKALATGEAVLGRYPNDPEILYQLSRLHAERSSDLMSALLRAAPDSAWMHYANAEVQESLDRFDTAAQEYRNALEKDPRMIGVHYKLGRLILRGPRTPEALNKAKGEFQQELAVAPSNADAEYELGEIDREQGQAQAAITHFQAALRYQPEFLEARVAIAKALIELGRTADALPHLEEAVRLDPENKIAHYLLASAYKALGESDKATKEFAAYKRLGASTPPASSESSGSDHK